MKRHERFQTLSRSEFPHEEETLDYLFSNLPDREPFRAWSNFTFIDRDQNQHEVDLLLVTPLGIFLTELKSTICDMTFRVGGWTEHRAGSNYERPTPLKLTNEKAKRFKSLLATSRAFRGQQVPYVEPLVIFTARDPNARLTIEGGPLKGLLFDDASAKGDPELHGAVDVLSKSIEPRGILKQIGSQPNKETAKLISRAFDEFLSPTSRRILDSRPDGDIGGYELGDVLAETKHYRDFVAVSARSSVSGHIAQVRARIYYPGTDKDSRAAAQAARDREHAILHGLNHQHILSEKGKCDSPRGPVLFLQHPDVVALPLWLGVGRQSEGDTRHSPAFEARAEVFLQILLGVQYAHRKRVFHRAIRPDAVLVEESGGSTLEAYLDSWVTARDDYLGTAAVTQHVSRWVDEPDEVFLPLQHEETPKNPELQDVYSLGMLGVFLFTGTPPAQSLGELLQELKRNDGIRASDLSNSVSGSLDHVLYKATRNDPTKRYSSVEDLRAAFVSEVLKPEESGAAGSVSRPITDMIEGQTFGDSSNDKRFYVVKILGSGSTARAYRVIDQSLQSHDKQRVLKVALKRGYNHRLDAEADVLERLSDVQGIVRIHGRLTIEEHRVLILEDAGGTLREQIRSGGAPTVRDIEAVGRALCDLLEQLENDVILHRDIKPENLGYSSVQSGEVTLKLFDFSLANVPETELDVGTKPYRDVNLRMSGGDSRRKWDAHAERWSACVTLFEFVTQGQRPAWKNDIDPTTVNEPVLELPLHLFPSANRDELVAFFRRAFQLNRAERFDSAHVMAAHWTQVFDATTSNVTVSESKLAEAVTNSPHKRAVSQLPLDDELIAALEKAGIRSIADLKSSKFGEFSRDAKSLKKRVAASVYQQFRGLVNALRFVETQERTSTNTSPRDYTSTSMNRLADSLWGGGANDAAERDWVRKELIPPCPTAYEELVPEVYDPIGGEGHALDDMSVAEVFEMVERRESMAAAWERKQMLWPFRKDMADLIRRGGGIRTFQYVVQAMRAKRGDYLLDETQVLCNAIGVCRASLAAETVKPEKKRFESISNGSGSFLYETSLVNEDDEPQVRRWLNELGNAVDVVVETGVPVSKQRALDVLRNTLVEGETAQTLAAQVDDQTLLDVAVEASATGALSTRGELYLRGMSALQVVKHASFVFQGVSADAAATQRLAELRERAMNQFKLGEELPQRDELIELLRAAGIGLKRSRGSTTSSIHVNAVTAGSRSATSTVSGSSHAFAMAAASYDDVERRLIGRAERGGALVIHAKEVGVSEVGARLANRYALALVDAEDVVFEALRAFLKQRAPDPAKREKIWNTFLANGDPTLSPKFASVLQQTRPIVEGQLEDIPARSLVYRTGILHAFGYGDILEELLRSLGSTSSERTLWVLESASSSSRGAVGLRNLIPYVDVNSSWARRFREATDAVGASG